VNRRGFLAFAAGTSGLLAGCSVGYTPTESTATPVPDSELTRAAPRDGIPAITDPAFGADWRDIEVEFGGGTVYRPRLAASDLVIGVADESTARAYPLKVLNWHEVVNDELPGSGRLAGPLLLTYCPRCRSGLAARRTVDGQATQFGVSGLLYRENLVVYDERTASLWSQLDARAIQGPATGTRLTVLPSALTEWETWRSAHPNTDVLLPAPRSVTVAGAVRIDYGFDLVGQTREAEAYLDERLGDDYDDSRLPPRELVLGVATTDAATAFPVEAVAGRSPINAHVGGRPIVVAFLRGSAVAYDRRVDGRPLRFERADGNRLTAGGSRWDLEDGVAIDGPHAGTRLTQANTTPPMFFFAWLSFHPETAVWRSE
jgi:catechol 2,3-dioxygenase-like lactoylglutathione lyase family enzyme